MLGSEYKYALNSTNCLKLPYKSSVFCSVIPTQLWLNTSITLSLKIFGKDFRSTMPGSLKTCEKT